MQTVLALAMGLVLGFAAHRAGICTVKAVAEIMTTRRGWLLWFFIRAALWTTAALSVAVLLGFTPPLDRRVLILPSIVGGVMFGIGAGLNNGCTYSTMTRVADGNFKFFATVLGWPAGMVAGGMAYPLSAAVEPGPRAGLPAFALVVLLAWIAYAAVRIVGRLSGAPGLLARFASPVYTLSAAAAVIGLANAVIVLAAGGWSFTGTVQRTLRYATCADCVTPTVPWLILAAAMAGMVASSLQRRSFRFRPAGPGSLLRHFAAGVVMGAGAALIPGGNDSLILFAIPSLSPHAIPAYLGLLCGIVIALALVRLSGEPPTRVECVGDICRQ